MWMLFKEKAQYLIFRYGMEFRVGWRDTFHLKKNPTVGTSYSESETRQLR